jgi:cyclic-di-GMP-binding protein
MPSFDVVSKLKWEEVQNALNQTQHELSQRFDFKGTGASASKTETGITIEASTDDRVKAAYEVLQEKLVRRKVSLKHFDPGKPQKGPKGTAKLNVSVQEGIDSDKARDIIKRIKDSKIKVQASIHEDVVRISGKKRDELQGIIALLKQVDVGIELQFVNFRD